MACPGTSSLDAWKKRWLPDSYLVYPQSLPAKRAAMGACTKGNAISRLLSARSHSGRRWKNPVDSRCHRHPSATIPPKTIGWFTMGWLATAWTTMAWAIRGYTSKSTTNMSNTNKSNTRNNSTSPSQTGHAARLRAFGPFGGKGVFDAS